MKKQTLVVLAASIVVLLAIGSIQAQKSVYPAPEADAFWEWVSQTDPYQGWGYWPGHEGIYKGQSPHGDYLKLYANSIALKAVRQGQIPFPAGSMIMKVNYAEDKETLMSLTPMYKVEGFNPQAGDWFWAKYKPNGKALASGKVKGCIDCHRSQKEYDWTFMTEEHH